MNNTQPQIDMFSGKQYSQNTGLNTPPTGTAPADSWFFYWCFWSAWLSVSLMSTAALRFIKVMPHY